jgi:mannose-6-phosphate isomerase
LDGKPRDLHLEESMLSTDFADFAPPLAHVESGVVAECGHFRVERKILDAPEVLGPSGDFALVTVVGGAASCGESRFATGDFFLLPASAAPAVSPATDRCAVLVTTIP